MNLEWLKNDSEIDRRQKKTRNAVERALLELLQKKPLEQITISELSELADINRKTFYNNYHTVEDVILGIGEKFSNYIFSNLPKRIDIRNEVEIHHLMLDLIHILEPQKDILKAMVKYNKGNLICVHLQNYIRPYLEYCLQEYKVSAEIIPYINTYIVSGLCSLFYVWLEDDSLSAERLAKLAYNLTVSAIHVENYKDV